MSKYPDVMRLDEPKRLTLQARHGRDRAAFEVDVDFERKNYWYGYRVAGGRGQEEFSKDAYLVIAEAAAPEYDDGSASLLDAVRATPPSGEAMTSGSAWNQHVRDNELDEPGRRLPDGRRLVREEDGSPGLR